MTGRIVKCPCGVEFETNNPMKKFCKRDCIKSPNHPWNEYSRNLKYRIRYGISVEEFNELFKKQNGCCAICGKHQTEFENRLSVDHCHKTKTVRGLLCHKCNRALGLFNDDPEIIAKAQEYVTSQDA